MLLPEAAATNLGAWLQHGLSWCDLQRQPSRNGCFSCAGTLS